MSAVPISIARKQVRIVNSIPYLEPEPPVFDDLFREGEKKSSILTRILVQGFLGSLSPRSHCVDEETEV